MSGFADKLESKETAEKPQISLKSAIRVMNGFPPDVETIQDFEAVLKNFEPLGVGQNYYSLSGVGTKSREMGEILKKAYPQIYAAAPKYGLIGRRQEGYVDEPTYLAQLDEWIAQEGAKRFGADIEIKAAKGASKA